MKRSQFFAWVLGPWSAMVCVSFVAAQQPPPPKGETLPANPIEVQTRGPLHEAIAQPFDPRPGTPIPKTPPAPVNEEPPALKLETENSEWLPGYWSWDPERQEFVWVSGVYRVPPQGRTFTPGHWVSTPEGWRWVSGFWSNATQPAAPYTAEPPAPLSVDPATPAPDENSLYIPGTWVARDNRFIWRPGYWSAAQTGRVWVPPHFVWTPAGYVFVDGYWDYPLEDRGLIFAPVYFNQPLPDGAMYQPDYVVNYPGFLDSAYYLPGFGQFYFGNYSAPRYARLGYQPWYAGSGRYNPVFAHHALQNARHDPNWFAGVQRTYAGRTSGQLAGPPLTLRQQNASNAVVVPLNQFKNNNRVRLVQSTPAQVNTQKAFVQQTRQIAAARSQADAIVITNGAGQRRTFNPTVVNSSPQVLTFPGGGKTRSLGSNSAAPVITNHPKVNVAPAIVNQQVAVPKTFTPAPRIAPQAQPIHTPAPRIVTPPPTPRIAPQAQRIHTPAPRIVTPPAPQRVHTPPPAPRVTAPVPKAGPAVRPVQHKK